MDIIKIFKHKEHDNYLDSETIKKILWYSPTKQTYIQRNDIYDNSILVETSINEYMLIFIKSILNIKKVSICKEILADSINNKENCIIFRANNKPIFLKLIEGFRNGVAHGGYISNKNDVKFLAQDTSRPEANINFYACIKKISLSSQ